MVRTRRRFVTSLILILLISAGSIACGFLYWTRPTHEVVAYLRIQSSPQITLQDNGTFRYIVEPPMDDQREMETIAALIRSPLVLGPALSDPEVGRLPGIAGGPDPIGFLQELIEIEVASPEVLVVTMAGREDQMPSLKAALDAVVNSFLKLNGSKDAERTRLLVELLTKELERRRTEIFTLTAETKQLRSATGESSDASLDLEFKQGELERAKKVYDAMALAIVELRTNMRAPERIERLSEATIRKLEKNRTPRLFAD